MAICNNKKCSLGECDQAETCTAYVPVITNADRIRAMSDEELADMLWKTGRNYKAVCADPVVDHNEQYEEIVKWLKQPAEEVGKWGN